MKSLSEQMLRIVKSFEKLMLEYKNSLANPQLCSLKDLVKETLKQYNFSLGEKEKITLDLSQDFRVKVPKNIFIFVIDNIIRNAYKHGKPKNINIWIEDHELHIKDDGIGIPPNKLSNIFEMFYTTGGQTSSGIGLAFAKQVIETLDGEIWCDSQVGENSYTEFTIKFPAILMDVNDEEVKESIIEEVKKKNAKLIAKNMLKKNMEEGLIKEITGLEKEDLE